MARIADVGSSCSSTMINPTKEPDDHISTDEIQRDEFFINARCSLSMHQQRRRRRHQPSDKARRRNIPKRTRAVVDPARWRLTSTLLFTVISLITMRVHGEVDARDLADNSTSTAVSSSEPSISPSMTTTTSPSFSPSGSPTNSPSSLPSLLPSYGPTVLSSESPSKLPSLVPSSSPSVQQSRTPSSSPSDQPSVHPSPSPSSHPSTSPSLSPSSLPTATPSKIPSASPSSKPSTNPTVSPSFHPSLSPSEHPTMQPSVEPSSKPSGLPSVSPTATPSAFPSDIPSAIPSVSPSGSPSTSPSASPSLTPSSMPTTTPSTTPSATPSLTPSSMPTSTPSVSPSVSAIPSNAPSTSPSTQPSLRPSASPSHSPSSAPSSEPTSIPSQSPTLPLQSFNIEMKFNFDDLQLLNEEETYHWGNVTQARIYNELSTIDDGVLTQLSVETRLVRQDQDPLPPPSDDPQGRRLQVKRPLNVTSANLISFRTPETISNDEMTSLVGEAFNNPSDRNAYLDELQSRQADGTHEAFSTINSVWVDVNGVRQDAPDPVSKELSNEPGGVNMAFVVGPIVGGLCALLLSGFFVLRRRNASSNGGSDSPSGDQRVSTVIEVERAGHDEVSTLGDPTCLPGTMFATGMLERDDTVTESIVIGDYDYTRAYGGGGPGSVSTAGRESGKGTDTTSDRDISGESRTASGLLTASSGNISNEVVPRLDSSSLFSDDASFEQQYSEDGQQIKVTAPAGKLGIVIDRPGGGFPMVHAIKDTSILADQVRVGDRLLSVDGEDTTALSAIEVSKLISMKEDRPSRDLIFLRTREVEQP